MPLSSIRHFTPATISLMHSQAASFLWTRILTGKLPECLENRLQRWPSFSAVDEARQRAAARDRQTLVDPFWSYNFQQELAKLLHQKPMSTTLKLDYHPTGLLETAARKSGIDNQLFPKEQLSMTFTNMNLILNKQVVIKLEDLIRLQTHEEDQVNPNCYVPLGIMRRNG